MSAMQTPSPAPLAVDVREAATMMRLSVSTVRGLLHDRSLPCVRIGRYIRIRVEAIRIYLERLEQQGGGAQST